MRDFLVFALGAAVSLSASVVLVTRLERLGARFGASEALLGVMAALAGDAPEITSAVAALAQGQQQVGAGVVLGSNVFNLAALLGLGAVVAGRIGLHRKVVVMEGLVGMWLAGTAVIAVAGLVAPAVGLLVALLALVPYVALDAGERLPSSWRFPSAWSNWLATAVVEEELELQEAIRPQRGTSGDGLIAVGVMALVIGGSVAMEQAASLAGQRYAVPEIVIGGLVLAAVTSLPNAVAAVYFAARGRGAAALSTTLNSNALNVTVGLLLPGAVVGLGRPTPQTALVVGWYLGLTLLVLALAYRHRGLGRSSGAAIIGGYGLFVAALMLSLRLA